MEVSLDSFLFHLQLLAVACPWSFSHPHTMVFTAYFHLVSYLSHPRVNSTGCPRLGAQMSDLLHEPQTHSPWPAAWTGQGKGCGHSPLSVSRKATGAWPLTKRALLGVLMWKWGKQTSNLLERGRGDPSPKDISSASHFPSTPMKPVNRM